MLSSLREESGLLMVEVVGYAALSLGVGVLVLFFSWCIFWCSFVFSGRLCFYLV
jgi:hypothetical protein